MPLQSLVSVSPKCPFCLREVSAQFYDLHTMHCSESKRHPSQAPAMTLEEMVLRDKEEAYGAHLNALYPGMFTERAHVVTSRLESSTVGTAGTWDDTVAQADNPNTGHQSSPDFEHLSVLPDSDDGHQWGDEDSHHGIPVDNAFIAHTSHIDISISADSDANSEPIQTSLLQHDDIRVVTHPHAGIPPRHYQFDEYISQAAPGSIRTSQDSDTDDSDSDDTPERLPWRPFPSRADFELAELMLECHLNSKQRSRLLGIISRTKAPLSLHLNKSDDSLSEDIVTIETGQHLEEVWSDALKEYDGACFLKETFILEHTGRSFEFEVYFCPIMEWIKELLLDPAIVSQFEWNARQISRYDESLGTFVRIIHEPWTADAWWEFQDTIPTTAHPFHIIFYSDKTHLSSFGTAKGYPVLVRCANLPTTVRNGVGVAGGRLVGWLPVPTEDAQRSGNYAYVNMKREVWHKSVQFILESMKGACMYGFAIKCGDGVQRVIYPTVLILSADYEEMCTMTLTRGTNANKPCPVCLVPNDEQSMLSVTHTLRTVPDMERIWEQGRSLRNQGDRNRLLQGYGLRDIRNVFWDFKGIQLYDAVSWDRLHAYSLGLFGDHLLGQVKDVVTKELARSAAGKIDAGFQAIPRWRELEHFDTIFDSGEYKDGSKFENMSKVIVFAIAHVFTPDATPRGWILLQLIRSFVELNMYASLTVHNDIALKAMEEELKTFDRLLQAYKVVDEEGNKVWNFPKIHTQQHIVQDIRRKGVTRNYNTKVSEKANGPYKKYYQNHTNFKYVAKQILKVSEMQLVAIGIRDKIEQFELARCAVEEAKKRRQHEVEAEGGGDSGDISTTSVSGNESHTTSTVTFERIKYGARRDTLTIAEIISKHPDDPAYENLTTKIKKYLLSLLPTAARRHARVEALDTQVITTYHYMKVQYADEVDWYWKTDILRANPNFHHYPRYDYVLVQISGNRCYFAQLVSLFTMVRDAKVQLLALVVPFNARPRGANSQSNKDLRLRLVRKKARMHSRVIAADTIIRGGLLAPDHRSSYDEYFVVEFIDEDMWIRLQSVELVIE